MEFVVEEATMRQALIRQFSCFCNYCTNCLTLILASNLALILITSVTNHLEITYTLFWPVVFISLPEF
jgi:hypothetical protein